MKFRDLVAALFLGLGAPIWLIAPALATNLLLVLYELASRQRVDNGAPVDLTS